MRVFFDSSAWAKRYIQEKGSGDIKLLLSEEHEVCLSILISLETISAFRRLKHEKKISSFSYQHLKKQFSEDLKQCSLVDFSHEVLSQAIFCIERNHLRSLDSIHVASASLAECELFVSADKQQLKAAQNLGMKVQRI